MSRFRLLALLIAVPWLVGTASRAQDEGAAKPFEGRVDVAEVLLDVLVTDGDGHIVLGLRPDDFRVTADGEPLEVVAATFYSNRRLLDEETAERLGIDTAAVSDQRLFILFFDDQSIRAHEAPELLRRQRQAGREAVKWIGKELLPGDLVAVAGFRRSHLELYSDFTTDRDATIAAIARAARGEPSTARWPSRMRPESALPSLRSGLAEPDELARATPTIEKALAALGEASTGIVGRKNLVLFTSGFGRMGSFGFYAVESRTFEPMVEALNAGNVAAYVADLVSPLASHSLEGSASVLADETGGIAFVGRPRFDRVLDRIGDSTNGYYLVAVRPREGRAGEYHEIEVELGNPEFRVTARGGFRVGGEG